MTKQITPAILRLALEQEGRKEPRPVHRSVLRQILGKLKARGIDLAIVKRGHRPV